jgi:hypothetical protein
VKSGEALPSEAWPSEALPDTALPDTALPKRRCLVRRCLGGVAVIGNAVLGNAFFGNAFLLGCAPPTRYESPSTIRGYEILVTRQDSLGRGIAAGLAQRGFRVRTRVRGGSRPTAYLLAFIFRETEPPALTWLHVRLADTRTGAIVATVSAPLDSLGPSAAERARAMVDSLAANPALRARSPT